MKDLTEVVDKVKGVEEGVNNLIIPILKDSIRDGNNHNKRLFVINMMLVLALVVVSIASMIIITRQNDKYIEFMEQFDFESSNYVQDLNTNDGGDAIINSGITVK